MGVPPKVQLWLLLTFGFNCFQWFAPVRYLSSTNTTGIFFQKYVYSSFSMKMALYYFNTWSLDLFLFEDKAPKKFLFECSNKKLAPCQLVLSGAVDLRHKSHQAHRPIFCLHLGTLTHIFPSHLELTRPNYECANCGFTSMDAFYSIIIEDCTITQVHQGNMHPTSIKYLCHSTKIGFSWIRNVKSTHEE